MLAQPAVVDTSGTQLPFSLPLFRLYGGHVMEFKSSPFPAIIAISSISLVSPLRTYQYSQAGHDKKPNPVSVFTGSCLEEV
jgi:hypothetical protein